MENLHFNYAEKLLHKARAELQAAHPHNALAALSGALEHLDILAQSPRVRGGFPLEQIQGRRLEVIELFGRLPALTG